MPLPWLRALVMLSVAAAGSVTAFRAGSRMGGSSSLSNASLIDLNITVDAASRMTMSHEDCHTGTPAIAARWRPVDDQSIAVAHTVPPGGALAPQLPFLYASVGMLPSQRTRLASAVRSVLPATPQASSPSSSAPSQAQALFRLLTDLVGAVLRGWECGMILEGVE